MFIDSKPGQGTLARVSIPQEVADPSPCISVGDKENIHAAGFLSFMTTKDPKVREFYMEMIGHLSTGLGVNFVNTKSAEELKELLASPYSVTHLFVGTGEYLQNKDLIDGLTGNINVVLVEDRDYNGDTGANIALLPKPFCGAQAANFLNYSRVDSGTDNGRLTCPGVRALVVDDEPMNLLVARGIFETYGMIVSTAPSGEEAIRMCADADYDIIFMDHMMPGMDGVEAMKRLRADAAKNRKDLCIVALTANAASSAKEMFLSEGFDGFIPKPIELIDLERVLRHVLPKSAISYETEPQKKSTKTVTVSQTGAPAPDDDPYSVLRACGVDIDTGLRYCQNDKDFYRELLSEYAKERRHKLDELDSYYGSADWSAYGIRVHAIKSTSKMIGALKLSETAKALEAAAKDTDTAFIQAEHEAFMQNYSRLMDVIAGFTGETGGIAEDDGPLEFTPEDDGPLEFTPEDDGEVFEFAPGGEDE
jgi:CheY-like chemotaxis protein/HPt (histidine-containing phosphotransfer) domain-containing protein